MASDIKKRSASNIYYGVHKETGELLHISDVPSGLKCDCVCAACGQPFEAKKGDIRRHHFAHVSNYECMYASEVAIYKAMADVLEKKRQMTLPPIELKFPAWHTAELLQDEKAIPIDSIEFKCEPLSYPPFLTVCSQGSALRILLDFDNYYDDNDLMELSRQAQKDGYSLLRYPLPRLDKDVEFTPERISNILDQPKNASWAFSRLEQHWKKKYHAVAVEPRGYGTGYLCPISIQRYKGMASARWVDCAYCRFNIAAPPASRCMAYAGVQKKDDFERPKAELWAEISKIRAENERKLREREERIARLTKQSQQHTRIPYVKQACNARQPVRPEAPSQEQLDTEYKRICNSFDVNSEEWAVDRFGRRWIMCERCGQIKRNFEMTCYGGPDGPNKGICSACSRKQS